MILFFYFFKILLLLAFRLLIIFIEYDFTQTWECRLFASWLILELAELTREKVSFNEQMTRGKKKGITFSPT